MADDADRQVPDEAAVRAALAATLAGKAFRDSPQLRAFLTFIVGETLAGRSAELKGYSIATLALGRPADFDPQTDPIVRVQAGRLRQALAEHEAETPDAGVVIRLDRGTYAPTFALRLSGAAPEPAPMPAEPPPAMHSPAMRAPTGFPRRLLVIGAAALAAAAAGIAVLDFSGFRRGTHATVPRPEASYPHLVVEPEGPATAESALIAGRVRDAIVKFDDLVVVADAGGAPPTRAAPAPGPRDLLLRIKASPAGEGQLRIALRLISRGDMRVIWSRELDPLPAGTAGDRALTAAIRAAAAQLAQPYGVIHAYARELLGAGGSREDPFACVVAGLDYWLTNDRAAHLRARRCIEEQLASYPGFGPLHAQMTYLHLEEFRQGYNPLPGDARARALESARMAVLHRPASARSHQAKMAANFANGDLQGAWRAGAEALALNPFDAEIIADIGSYRVMAGEFEAGLAYLDQAVDLNTAPPAWVLTFRALALYMLGRLEASGPMARALEGSSYPPAQMALILAAFQFRDAAQGRRHLETFRKTHPEVARNPAALLLRMNFQEDVINRVMLDFDRAVAWISAQ